MIVLPGPRYGNFENRVAFVWFADLSFAEILKRTSTLPPVNLMINAMDAISDAEAKEREVSVTTNLSGAIAEIRISDTGPGITAGDLKSVFDPFFTTKPQGMGMGLAIVCTIVDSINFGLIHAAMLLLRRSNAVPLISLIFVKERPDLGPMLIAMSLRRV